MKAAEKQALMVRRKDLKVRLNLGKPIPDDRMRETAKQVPC